ncbi:DUF3870 domain-containing protein [Paraburkholderia lycopersici]|uniref:DUF3870 domain-containing protein n=1 Tax=Paraburkholderia lycopersici TaxID=416944 RepID=A0A1G6QU26_9BURK|nr:DUF3870 domain-containing protein [Paraburkholderia lycopersici]SDC95848.1 protein of unknown function [Paraburkholderia lycopersici]
MSRAQTRFVAGHARLPQGMAAQHLFESLSVTVEIDAKYAVILEASCTLATEHGRTFIRDLLRGHSLRDGAAPVVERVQRCYIGRAGLALVAALKDLHLQYERSLSEAPEPRLGSVLSQDR